MVDCVPRPSTIPRPSPGSLGEAIKWRLYSGACLIGVAEGLRALRVRLGGVGYFFLSPNKTAPKICPNLNSVCVQTLRQKGCPLFGS